MGTTIHYRGTMDDIGQIETMEDRMLDLVFSVGGRATIWRSFADEDTSRAVRGLIVDLEPGQETLSLLISPEGHLTPLCQIEDAEKAPFDEPPQCSVKTQFGSLQGHILIVHLLDALKQRFCSNLTVDDEGEYYEHRDVNRLQQKMQFLGAAIDAMSEGLREHGLSAEAAEDPNILATRIERVAAVVQEKIFKQPLEPSGGVKVKNGLVWSEPTLDDEVEAMDRHRRHNDMQAERMARRITEAKAAGLTDEEALELAIEEGGSSVPRREPDEQCDFESSDSWTDSLPSHFCDDTSENSLSADHPAVARAQAFLMQAMDLKQDEAKQSPFLSIFARASMELVGGLVQATCGGEPDDNTDRALIISQLKRAQSGHAYAHGAIIALRNEAAITEVESHQLHEQLEWLLATIHELIEAAYK